MSTNFMVKKIANQKFLNAGVRIIMCQSFSTQNSKSNLLKCDSSDVTIPKITLPEFIFPKLEEYHKYVATECFTSKKTYTFAELRLKSNRLNKALRKIFKLKETDVVGLFMVNRPEFIVSALGVFEAGLILTTLNPNYTPDEIFKQMVNASVKLIITETRSVNTVQTALKLAKINIPIVAIKNKQNENLPQGVVDFEELINSNFDIPEVQYGKCDDLAFLPYSSGTTGLPKGVELTHYNLISNICQMDHSDFNYWDPPTDSFQDIVPAVLPFYHIFGFSVTFLQAAYHGAKSVTLEKFSPQSFTSLLKDHRATMLYAAPPLILFLASDENVKPEYLKHLKQLTSGAAPLGFLDEERLLNKIGKGSNTKMIQGYGLTETSPIVTYHPKWMNRAKENSGSIGTPVPNTLVKITNPDDPTATPLGANTPGEVLVKGPQVMKGYYKNDKDTNNTIVDGWLKTGDIGYYNENNLIFITDRIKELIKVKGFQVAPAELEEIIRDFSSVEDVAVIGIPHPRYGEVPRAYVVPKKETLVDTEKLKEYVAKKVAKYKQLEGGVRIVEIIPKNPSGKILRRKLKADYIETGI